ncbi:hypothetical protein HYPSUDRAFT_202534 [Hypholoma sublateritium FD-334 SS-4]|uniref:Uncharacterized protein n=1 Tax=Hypholoma sublateritium (strain FD-334 SS-4) TaxID=945553 RepID=A0A0D2MEM9_HYPSF|nr:hypothetical protein HYPSUDRAFT_202534 [Hypholoma sublateritium FD-334 SS-4]
MAETDDPSFHCPMDTDYKDLYDRFDFFEAQALPATNTTSPQPHVADLYNTPWVPMLAAPSTTGGPPTSQGSYMATTPTDGINSLIHLFELNPHPHARKHVTLGTLFDDRRIKDGIAIFAKMDPAAEHLVKPKFKSNIPKGGEGVWSIYSCFCWEIDQRLAVDLLAGVYSRLSIHASTVIGLLGGNRAFQTLYQKHMKSPLAITLANNSDLSSPNTIYTYENLEDWDFQESTAGTNPVMRVLKRDVISFTQERHSAIIMRTQSEISSIMIARPTLGKTLLSDAGWDGPRTRAKRANIVLNKIFPNHNGVTLGQVASDKALVGLFSLESTMAAANNFIDAVGAINISLGSYRLVKTFRIPWEIIPFAAALVDIEARTVRHCGNHPSAARAGLFHCLSMFSRSERKVYEFYYDAWIRLTTSGSGYKAQLDKVLKHLDEAQDLGLIATYFLPTAIPQNIAGG